MYRGAGTLEQSTWSRIAAGRRRTFFLGTFQKIGNPGSATLSRDDDELRAAVFALTRAAAHRPLHPESDGAAAFRAAQRRAADDLVARHPHVERALAPLRASFEE